MTKRRALWRAFRSLGWQNDPQSKAVFDLLVEAGKRVGPGGTLLDLGAGTCRYSFFFEHCNYIAVDSGVGDSTWDYGRLDILGDICTPDFVRNDAVDCCLSTSTLEHLSEPSDFFASVERVLKPGGRLFLYVPFIIQEHQVPHDYYRYTSYGLEYLCEKNGLHVVSIEPSNGPMYTSVRLSYAALCTPKDHYLPARLLTLGLKVLYRSLMIPLFYWLDRYSQSKSMPGVWLLVAEKPGITETHKTSGKSKQEVIWSIIQCPKCGGELRAAASSYHCGKCMRKYTTEGTRVSFLE